MSNDPDSVDASPQCLPDDIFFLGEAKPQFIFNTVQQLPSVLCVIVLGREGMGSQCSVIEFVCDKCLTISTGTSFNSVGKN